MKKIVAVVIACILGGVILYNLNPTEYYFMPKCPLKLITGLSCPGCGIQRAIHALLHGEIVKAISFNYYLVYSGPYAASFILLWLLPENTYKEKFRSVIENKYVVDFYIFSFIIWMVMRNILKI